jgi:hypothetical protein
MKHKKKSSWGGIALAAAGAAGIFLLLKDKGQLLQKGLASLKASPAGRAAAPTPPRSHSTGKQPTAANGHVRDVDASNPPAPDSGTNFTPQGDVHAPQS